MRIINTPVTGWQARLKDFYSGCCNIESIIACDMLLDTGKVDMIDLLRTLEHVAENPPAYSCSNNGYVNSSADLLRKIGSKRKEIFRGSIEDAHKDGFWQPGAYAVARFRNGTVEHSVVIRIINEGDYEVVFDGYGLSNAVRYGFVNSVRFYA